MEIDQQAAQLLLRICANPDGRFDADFASLSEPQWQALKQKAWDKRVGPLVHRALERADWLGRLPGILASDFQAMVQWHSFTALRQVAGLARALAILDDQGIRPIALKGFALAYRAYPRPVLRPLRDVDLLVPEEQAETAQALLLGGDNYTHSPWAGRYGTEFGHQLPEIEDNEFELTIEIHHRVNARGWAEEPALLAKLRDEAEPLAVMGREVLVPSAHANMLHLIEHATLHHAFENGPNILPDIHFLAASQPIDWDRLEVEAREMGLANSLRLIAAVAGDLGATWVPPRLAGEAGSAAPFIETARTAMLQDTEDALRHKMLIRIGGEHGPGTGLAGAFVRALRPNPYQLARIAKTDPASPRRWLAYPVWLWRRGRLYFSAGDEAAAVGAEGELRLRNWLFQRESSL